MDNREQLDRLIATTNSCDKDIIPNELLNNINKWKWGKYGWTSPVSLFLTAAWHKYNNPKEDCCKIWAKDEQSNPIPKSYSIRSEDESIVIPLLAKYDLCQGFCSANSGMQGSRAIEKMRAFKRMNVDFDKAQRTIFDLKLFAIILNQINELNQTQCLEFCRYFILIAKGIQASRLKNLKSLESFAQYTTSTLHFLSETHDPELTKCVTAACLSIIYSQKGFSLDGVSDAKTAADARAKKPGDLCIIHDNVPVTAIEVKDKTQEIDWNNITRACSIIKNFPSLRLFLFVLEKRSALTTPILNDIVSSQKIAENIYASKIDFISVHGLYQMALSLSNESIIANLTSKYIAITPAIKPETIKNWLAQQKS